MIIGARTNEGVNRSMPDISEVNKNMMRPEAFRYRGNTGNTGYGFDQVVETEQSQP